MLQSSSKRSVSSASRRLAQASTSGTTPRCVCAFSSSCKSSQHQSAPEGPAGQANVNAYDRLFAGLNPATARSGSNAAASQRKIVSAYGPSFAYAPDDGRSSNKTGRPRRAGRVSPTKQRLNPVDLERFRSSMDVLFPISKEGTISSKGKVLNADTEGLESRQKFQWADLLDKVTKKQEMQRSQEQTDVKPASLRPFALEMETARQQKEAESLDRNLSARNLSETLKEEVKDLTTAVDALNWVESRIFSATNPEALIHKVQDPSIPADSEHRSLYPYLLTDLSKILRSVAPHAALLPLKIASSLSPASYLYGCTPALYASTMKTRWEVWGDIEGCHELLVEMDRGAVNLDSRIFGLIEEMQEAVYRDRRKAEKHVAEEQAAQEERSAKDDLDASAASKEGAGPETPFSPFATSQQNIQLYAPEQKISLEQSNRVQEKAYERLVESKTFFSPAQRRSLRDMERIVVDFRKRLHEHQQKEDRLEDAIRARAIGEDASDGEGSSINAIVDSYGKLERPSQEEMGVSSLASRNAASAFQKPFFADQRGSKDARGANGLVEPSGTPGAAAPEDDILSRAIDEMAEQPTKILARSKSRPGSKGKKARSKKVTE